MPTDHACSGCSWHDLGFPCRVAEHPDVETVAQAYIASLSVEPPPSRHGDLHWSWDCVRAAVQDTPEFAWPLILECVRLLKTEWQATELAAGHLEDFVRVHGEAFIDCIEAEARRSLRFRFVLSGVWVHGLDPANEIRRRIERLQASGPGIDAGDPLPPV
jgi:hypothetical protein